MLLITSGITMVFVVTTTVSIDGLVTILLSSVSIRIEKDAMAAMMIAPIIINILGPS